MKKNFLYFAVILVLSNGLYCQDFNPYNLNVPWGLNKIPTEIQNNTLGENTDKVNMLLTKDLRPNNFHYDIENTPKDKLRLLGDNGLQLINISAAFNQAQTETWIALNPSNPSNIIAGCNDVSLFTASSGFKMRGFYTNDGGLNWTESSTPANSGVWFTPQNGAGTIFDPAITFDADGNAYYAYGYAETYYPDKAGQNSDNKNGVFVVKSTNGGSSWDGFFQATGYSIIPVTDDALKQTNNVFHDRYTIAADRNPNSPYKNNLYLAWYRIDKASSSNTGIVYSRSTDGGITWADSYKSTFLSLSASVQAPVPYVASNGDVYVSWIENDQGSAIRKAMVAKSVNGGVSFSNPIEAQRVYTIGDINTSTGRCEFLDKQKMRVSSNPQISVDNSSGAYAGNVYVVQPGREYAGGPYGVYVSKSTDGGKTWVKNIRIDNNDLRNDMFFASIDVDPKSGIVAVFYYSSQNDKDNHGIDGYLAVSKDGGDTWNQIRITPNTFYISKPADVFPQENSYYWGDYTSITAYDSKIYPLFWMPTGSNFSTCDLYTAVISPNPEPPQNLAATNVFENPLKIKLSWDHPQKDGLGSPLGDFKIEVYREDTKLGEVQKSETPEFIDNNVVDGQTYNYKLRTVTTTGSSIYAIVSIKAGGNLKPAPISDWDWRPTANGVNLTWKSPDTTVDGRTIDNIQAVEVLDMNNSGNLLTRVDGPFTAGVYSTKLAGITSPKYYNIALAAIYKNNGTEYKSDPNSPRLVFAGEPYTNFTENFDVINDLKPSYTIGSWGITSERSASPDNSLNQSPNTFYNSNMYYEYDMAPLVLESGKSRLTFDEIALIDTTQHSFNGVVSNDIGIVSVSGDFGKTWKNVRYIDARMSPKFILEDLAGSEFVKMVIGLDAYAGDTVMIRFGLLTDNIRQYPGWFIDNIEMTGLPVSVGDEGIGDEFYAANFPNPAQNFTNVNVKFNTPSPVTIALYDQMGKELNKLDYSNQIENYYNPELKLNGLPDGYYFIRITSLGRTKTLPLVIEK